MILKLAVGFLAIVAVAVSRHHHHSSEKTVVQDAYEQLTKSYRCWEKVDYDDDSKGYEHTEPINKMCSYLLDMSGKFLVAGVTSETQDYTDMKKIFMKSADGYQVLVGCLLEGFDVNRSNASGAITMMRCLCMRDGCNMPVDFNTFLQYNKGKIPNLH